MISLKTLRSLCVDFIIFFIPLYLLWQALPYIFSVLAPFLFGYLLYLAANPLNRRLRRVLPPALCSALSLFLISFAAFFVLRALFMNLFREVASLTQNSNALSDTIPFISRKMSAISSNRFFSALFDAFSGGISTLLLEISSFMLEFAKNIPSFLISLFASVFTAFFLLKDNSFIRIFLRDFFGKNALLKFAEIKNSLLDVIFSYLKAQFIIGSIIFVVLFIGFSCLGIKYALLLALFTAVVDAVPILGTGAVLLPLSVFNFFTGQSSLGWGILILYGIAILTRQLCEPKIIGQKLGIHPLLTLFSIFAGLQLFGIFGLITGPVIALIIKNLISHKRESVLE